MRKWFFGIQFTQWAQSIRYWHCSCTGRAVVSYSLVFPATGRLTESCRKLTWVQHSGCHSLLPASMHLGFLIPGYRPGSLLSRLVILGPYLKADVMLFMRDAEAWLFIYMLLHLIEDRLVSSFWNLRILWYWVYMADNILFQAPRRNLFLFLGSAAYSASWLQHSCSI